MTYTSYRRGIEAMGTLFEVFLFGDDEEHLEAVAVAVLEEIVRLDGVLSRFDPRSEIARVNREAGQQPVRIDREVFALLKHCEQARRLTGGYFDVTASAGIKVADDAATMQLDAESRTVQFTRDDIAVDLGAVGKGHALDCGREILLRFGVTSALLQGGTSSVLALGAPPGAGGWPVDIRHPLFSASAVARIKLAHRGFSCSAARHPGEVRSDIVNPHTGAPLAGNGACVVLADSATDAEIFSTALLAMGREGAVRWLQNNSLNMDVGWFEPGADFVWV